MENAVDEIYIDGVLVEPNNNTINFNEDIAKYTITELLDDMQMGEPIDDYDDILNELLHNEVGNNFRELDHNNDGFSSQYGISNDSQTHTDQSKPEIIEGVTENNPSHELQNVESGIITDIQAYKQERDFNIQSVQFKYDTSEQFNCEPEIDLNDQPGYFVEISTESESENYLEFTPPLDIVHIEDFNDSNILNNTTESIQNPYDFCSQRNAEVQHFNEFDVLTNEASDDTYQTTALNYSESEINFNSDAENFNAWMAQQNLSEIALNSNSFGAQQTEPVENLNAFDFKLNPAEEKQYLNIFRQSNAKENCKNFDTNEFQINSQIPSDDDLIDNENSLGYASNLLVSNKDVMYSQRCESESESERDEQIFASLFDFEVPKEQLPDIQYACEDFASTSNKQNIPFTSLTPLNTLDSTQTSSLFQCNVCYFQTDSMHGLTVHNRVHKISNYKCDYCNFATNKSYYLRRHIAYGHGEAYACETCDYVTHSSDRIKEHVRTMH